MPHPAVKGSYAAAAFLLPLPEGLPVFTARLEASLLGRVSHAGTPQSPPPILAYFGFYFSFPYLYFQLLESL